MNQIRLEDTNRLRVRIDDEERLESLRSYKILDTAEEPEYERLVDMVHAVCRSGWTAVTFVDRDRQWFKALRGFNIKETPRSMSFCSVSMQQLAPLIVENALLDRRFRDTYLVQEKGVRFFAGYPLFSSDGFGLGSVCVIDMHPRTLMTHQLQFIQKARDWVQADLDRRRTALMLNDDAACPTKEQSKALTQKFVLKKLVAETMWATMVSVVAAPSVLHG